MLCYIVDKLLIATTKFQMPIRRHLKLFYLKIYFLFNTTIRILHAIIGIYMDTRKFLRCAYSLR
jgi:hypothetical protein